LEHYGAVVSTLCRMQLEGKLSRQVEVSVIPACTPPHLVEPVRAALLVQQQQQQHQSSTSTTTTKHHDDDDEPVVVVVPDKLCLFQVYVMADTEGEFADLVRPITDETVFDYCLYRSDFTDATMSGLTDSVGPAYPPGLAWNVRSYQVETSAYAAVDWSRLAKAFADGDVAVTAVGTGSKSHILTAIGPDGGYASGGGAYGTFLPGLVVAVYYCATTTNTAVVDDDDDNNALDVRVEQRPHCHDELLRIVEEVLEPVATKYNPLEHPVHRDTFHRCYPPPNADRIRHLRDQFDPHHLFCDPATIAPFQ
jgi:hypothetical protein